MLSVATDMVGMKKEETKKTFWWYEGDRYEMGGEEPSPT